MTDDLLIAKTKRAEFAALEAEHRLNELGAELAQRLGVEAAAEEIMKRVEKQFYRFADAGAARVCDLVDPDTANIRAALQIEAAEMLTRVANDLEALAAAHRGDEA